MDTILADQLEWLVSGNMEGLRFKRQLVLVAGCLSDGPMPHEIEEKVSQLSRRIAYEEVFLAVLEPLNNYLRQVKDKETPNIDISSLVAQVEACRENLNQCEPPNMAAIVAWVLGKGREKNLVNKAHRRR